ncbi:MAG: hypothetical protein IT373_07115 [Polyangiaceae bacterium]|nr:hypothetical protein [Polyangiaceae bacterium]
MKTRPEVLTSLAEPCSYCGTTCTGTYRFWFAGSDADEAVEVDKHQLDAVLNDIVGAQDGPDAYALLPAFIRGRNECWDELSAGPVALDGGDFDRVLVVLEGRAASKQLSPRQCALVIALRQLSQRAAAEGACVQFLDD